MANAHYYGTLFKSNGTATVAPTEFDGELPALSQRGVAAKASGSVAYTAALVSTDTLYLARVPAGHRVSGLKFRFAEIDSGTSTTMNIGTQADGTTYDDADAYAAASTLFRGLAVREFPSGTTDIAKDAPTTWWTGPGGNGTPNIPYNVVMVPGGTSTATSGTIYYEVEYLAEPTVYDNRDSPSVVTS